MMRTVKRKEHSENYFITMLYWEIRATVFNKEIKIQVTWTEKRKNMLVYIEKLHGFGLCKDCLKKLNNNLKRQAKKEKIKRT